MEHQQGTLRDLLTVLFKHRRKVLVVFFGVVAIVTALTFLLPPSYEAKSSLLVVGKDGSDDGYDIDCHGRNQFITGRGDLKAGVRFFDSFQRFFIEVANGNDLASLHTVEVPHDVWPPVTIPNHTHTNHFAHRMFVTSPPFSLPVAERREEEAGRGLISTFAGEYSPRSAKQDFNIQP